jgi:dienelactone hydrolase
MKSRKNIVIFVLAVLFSFTGCGDGDAEGPGISQIDWGDRNRRAEQFVEALANGDYETAAGGFDAAMKKALSVQGLKKAWEDTAAPAGGVVSIAETGIEPNDEYDIYNVVSRHENKGINTRVVFSKDNKVSGLFFTYVENERDTVVKQKDGYAEIPVTVGEGTEYPLNGMISMPNNAAGKVPAAVIVHGSGPLDMDGTVYANKPYREIADYLAENGVASIRYDKRTLTHGAKMDGSWTVMEEMVEDAVLAAEMLKVDPRIDGDRIFLIGHSMGGMLAPRIYAESGDYAGIIILAGSPRFLLDISKDQNIAYVNDNMEGEERDAALAQIEGAWDAQVNALVTLPDDTAKATPVESGASAYYFKDLYNNPASAYIENITAPFLVLQGSKDFQISPEKDFGLYGELLAGRQNAELKLYEGLNHLFMPSSTGNSDEYQNEGHMDSQVLADITAWIKSRF